MNVCAIDDGWRVMVYTKYWLDYHIATFKKPLVSSLTLSSSFIYQYPTFCIQCGHCNLFVKLVLRTVQYVQVALWHGLVMGGGAGLTVAGTFGVATEKTVSNAL